MNTGSQNTRHIITPKTAKYHIIGNTDYGTKKIWFALHGYGFLASDFAEHFQNPADEETVIIVPEALNKFYVKGFHGKVGASWMTSDERENEIKDYLNYLNNVYNQEVSKIFKPDLKINLLGFSQGTATAVRWALQNKFKADKLILWGGGLPRDIDYRKVRIMSAATELILAVGNNDEFITNERLEEEIEILDENKIRYTLKKYDGKHGIDANLLKELMS